MSRFSKLAASAAIALFAASPLLGAVTALPVDTPGPWTALSTPGASLSWHTSAPLPGGGTVVAWSEYASGDYTLLAARLAPATGWGPHDVVNVTVSPAGIQYLSLAVDGGGNITLFWGRVGTAQSVWMSRSSAAGSWTPATRVGNLTGYFNGPISAGADPAGRVLMMWVDSMGGPSQVWAARFDPASGLGLPERISSDASSATVGTVVVDRQGAATAIWCDWNGTGTNLSFSRALAGGPWSPFAVAVQDATIGCYPIAAAADAGGNVTVVWGRSGLAESLAAARFSPSSGWGPVEDISPLVDPAEWISLASAPDGHLMAAWQTRHFGFPFFEYYAFAAPYSPSSGWGPVANLSGTLDSPPAPAAAVVDGGSGAVAFGMMGASTRALTVAQFTVGSGCEGWSAPTDNFVNISQGRAELALGADGTGIVFWEALSNATLELRGSPFSILLGPRLSFSAPAAGTVVGQPVVLVAGSMGVVGTAFVGGIRLATDPNGNFSGAVPLQAGPNVVSLVAEPSTDWSPCTFTASLPVVFDDPVPALESALAAASANLTALTAALAASEAHLNDLEASGNATAADLAAARADLSAAQTALATTTAELNRVKVQFPWLQSNLTELENRLAQASADANQLSNQITGDEVALAKAQDDLAATSALSAQLASQLFVLSLLAVIALLASFAGIGLSLVQARRLENRRASADKTPPPDGPKDPASQASQSADPAKSDKDKGPPPKPGG